MKSGALPCMALKLIIKIKRNLALMNLNVEQCHQSINNDELSITKVERETFPWSLYVLESLHAKKYFSK